MTHTTATPDYATLIKTLTPKEAACLIETIIAALKAAEERAERAEAERRVVEEAKRLVSAESNIDMRTLKALISRLAEAVKALEAK